MKALSIRQPWAWLIIKGEKPIENRSWVSNHRGPLLIHASQEFDKAGYQWVRKNFPRLKMSTPAKFTLGALIGTVEMVGLIIPGEDYRSAWFSGPYGFLFRSPKEFETPIPWKGQLGFFEVPEKLLTGI